MIIGPRHSYCTDLENQKIGILDLILDNRGANSGPHREALKAACIYECRRQSSQKHTSLVCLRASRFPLCARNYPLKTIPATCFGRNFSIGPLKKHSTREADLLTAVDSLRPGSPDYVPVVI